MNITTINSRFHSASSKGVSAQLTLLTIIFPHDLEWDEFETLPEELHLTNVAFEVFQIQQTEQESFFQSFEVRREQDYDVRGLLFLNLKDVPEGFKKNFDFCVSENFEDGIDIAIIEDLRFKIAEFT